MWVQSPKRGLTTSSYARCVTSGGQD
jgi:hypothetical protein